MNTEKIETSDWLGLLHTPLLWAKHNKTTYFIRVTRTVEKSRASKRVIAEVATAASRTYLSFGGVYRSQNRSNGGNCWLLQVNGRLIDFSNFSTRSTGIFEYFIILNFYFCNVNKKLFNALCTSSNLVAIWLFRQSHARHTPIL